VVTKGFASERADQAIVGCGGLAPPSQAEASFGARSTMKPTLPAHFPKLVICSRRTKSTTHSAYRTVHRVVTLQ